MHPILFLKALSRVALFAEALSHAASEAYSFNDRQGGARGFIVNTV